MRLTSKVSQIIIVLSVSYKSKLFDKCYKPSSRTKNQRQTLNDYYRYRRSYLKTTIMIDVYCSNLQIHTL